MQVNSKCKLCGDKNETITHIISECIKLEKKEYMTGHCGEGNALISVQEI